MQQNVFAITCHPAFAGVLMKQRKKRMFRVGYNLKERIPEQRFIKSNFIEYLTQIFTCDIGGVNEGLQFRFRLGHREAFARNIVRFVVDDAAVSHRTT